MKKDAKAGTDRDFLSSIYKKNCPKDILYNIILKLLKMNLLFLFLVFLLLATIVSAMSGMGFTSMNGWPSNGVSSSRIWDIGATWRDIHLNVDVYDWSKLDQVVSQMQSIGSKIIYVSILFYLKYYQHLSMIKFNI